MASLDEHARAGIDAINRRQPADAIEHFEAALAIDDARPDLHNALGMAYLHLGRVGDAIPSLERSIELAASFTDDDVQDMKRHMHLTLATAYEVADRPADARRALERTVAAWPAALEPRLQLGQLLLAMGAIDDGLATYRTVSTFDALDEEGREAAKAVVGSVEVFLRSEQPASVFLEAHAAEYRRYFDEVLAPRAEDGWYGEAARMARGPDGEPRPIIPDGARPYAMQRVDLVNPADGTISDVYAAGDPMVVAINGVEPLAQLPVVFTWERAPLRIEVSTQCPWHWLPIAVVFERPDPAAFDALDELFGDWYLAGYNGEFGEREGGRFHFISDPDLLGERTVIYTVDLGRARFDAIGALRRRLDVLHARHPIARVVFGHARVAV